MRGHRKRAGELGGLTPATTTTRESYHPTAPLSTTFLRGLFSRVQGVLSTATTPDEERLALLLLDRLTRLRCDLERRGGLY